MIEVLNASAEGDETNPELIVTIRIPVKEYNDSDLWHETQEYMIGKDLIEAINLWAIRKE